MKIKQITLDPDPYAPFRLAQGYHSWSKDRDPMVPLVFTRQALLPGDTQFSACERHDHP